MMLTFIISPIFTEMMLTHYTPREFLPLHQLINKNLRILQDFTSNSLVYHLELEYQTHTIQRLATTPASSPENTQAHQPRLEIICQSTMAISHIVSHILLELEEHCPELTRTVLMLDTQLTG